MKILPLLLSAVLCMTAHAESLAISDIYNTAILIDRESTGKSSGAILSTPLDGLMVFSSGNAASYASSESGSVGVKKRLVGTVVTLFLKKSGKSGREFNLEGHITVCEIVDPAKLKLFKNNPDAVTLVSADFREKTTPINKAVRLGEVVIIPFEGEGSQKCSARIFAMKYQPVDSDG